MTKMLAALWYGPEEMRLEQIQVPQIQRDEVLVKIGTALTCGTDFKLFRQGHALLVKDVPSRFGHELAGTIVQAGSQVTNFQEGDQVVAANSAPCGECFFCGAHQENLCEDLQFLNGAYAEYIVIPSRIVKKNLYKIPEGLTFRLAAFTEPLACVLHCVDKLQLKQNKTLCILGTGTCGLLFVQLAKLYGARIISVGRGDQKLQIAKQLGAHHTFSILGDQVWNKIRQVTPEGRGPDMVIDAVGRPESWQSAVELVRRGGHVWFYGGCATGSTVTLNTHRLHYEEITCAGVFHHTPNYFAKSLNLIAEGKIDVASLIHGEKRLADLNEVFQKGVTQNPLKIAIIP